MANFCPRFLAQDSTTSKSNRTCFETSHAALTPAASTDWWFRWEVVPPSHSPSRYCTPAFPHRGHQTRHATGRSG